MIGALHPDLEEAARRVLGAQIVENILTSGPPVLTEALETVPDLLATGGVMFEIVFVDHLFGVGAGRPLESRVHAELRKAARGAGLVVQVKHPLPIRGEADVSAGATSYVRGAHLGRVHLIGYRRASIFRLGPRYRENPQHRCNNTTGIQFPKYKNHRPPGSRIPGQHK